jgi:hypothetical protein
MTARRGRPARLLASICTVVVAGSALLAQTGVAGAVVDGAGLPSVPNVPGAPAVPSPPVPPSLPDVGVPDPPALPPVSLPPVVQAADPPARAAPGPASAAATSPAGPSRAGSGASPPGTRGTGSAPPARSSGPGVPGRRSVDRAGPRTASGSSAPARAGEARSRVGRTVNSARDALGSLGERLPLPLPVPDWSKPIILVLLLLAGGFAARARLTSTRARRIEAQRGRLAEDVDAMQAALVPEVPARAGGLSISVDYRPADGPAAGGDFYNPVSLGEDRVAIILGDVSGHGREALARAALMRYTLRAYVQAGLEPRMALKLAGEVLAGVDGDFTTVVLAIHDSTKGRLTYSTAGHPPPILLGPPAHEPLTICPSSAIGWGLPTGRRQTTVSLPAGALAGFFSDGLSEARLDGRLLGRERVEEILAGLGPAPSAGEWVEAVRAETEQAPDDMLAFLVQATASGAEPSGRVEELELSRSELSDPRVEAFLEACGVPTAEIPPAIALAGTLAAEVDGALFRVQVDADPPVVEVRPAPQLHSRDRTGPDVALGELLLT